MSVGADIVLREAFELTSPSQIAQVTMRASRVRSWRKLFTGERQHLPCHCGQACRAAAPQRRNVSR